MMQGTDYAILKMTQSLWVADKCQTLCLSLLLIYTYNILAKWAIFHHILGEASNP